ncbi:MAG TPA: hypothetical protein VHB98_24190 [Chloroflexota bacterium]|jgi:hypothetical protein|nr:hypothetical protein [Chloroflexota bacterium]
MLQDEFEDIVEAYQLAHARGERDALERLTAAHPRYADRLLAFALFDATVPSTVSAADLAPLQARITPVLRQRALAAAFAEMAPTPVALAGILRQGELVGLSPRALATAVDLPRDLLLQLDKRLIAPTSVPARCLARLASTLQTSVEALQTFLAGGAATRVAAYNFAPAPPQAGTQQTFADALAGSALATPEQRAYWQDAIREEHLDA